MGHFGDMSGFYQIKMNFGMKLEFEVLDNFPKFGRDQLISYLTPTLTKKFRYRFFAPYCNRTCCN